MLDTQDEKTRKRVNNAIANIRLIASSVKRVHVADAQQKCEIVVKALNEFRQYVSATVARDTTSLAGMPFQIDQSTIEGMVAAIMQADDIYNKLTKVRQKKYQEEYRQVWNLLENIHSYLERMIKKGGTNGK